MTTQTPIPGAGKERTAGETAAFTACILLFHLLLLALAPSFCRPIEDPYLRVSALKGFQIAACLLPALLFRVWGDVREPLPRVRRKNEILLYSLIALAVVSAGLQINVTVNEFLSALNVLPARAGSTAVFYGPVGVPFTVLAYVLIPAFCEEVFFRYTLFYVLGGTKTAAILSAFCFAFSHLEFFGFLYTLIAGIALGLLVYATRRLFLAVLLHAALNAVTLLLVYLSRLLPAEVYLFTETALWFVILAAGAGCALFVSTRLFRRQRETAQSAIDPELAVLPRRDPPVALPLRLVVAVYLVIALAAAVGKRLL